MLIQKLGYTLLGIGTAPPWQVHIGGPPTPRKLPFGVFTGILSRGLCVRYMHGESSSWLTLSTKNGPLDRSRGIHMEACTILVPNVSVGVLHVQVLAFS